MQDIEKLHEYDYSRNEVKKKKKKDVHFTCLQVKEAIEVFDKWMIEQDRVKPTIFEYGVMISLLGRAGYTHKAFQLHKQVSL